MNEANPLPPQGPDLPAEALWQKIHSLEAEVARLKAMRLAAPQPTVKVPPAFAAVFQAAETTVRSYFERLYLNPAKGLIEIDNERYVLIRASSLSYDFFQNLRRIYLHRSPEEAFQMGQDFLFDFAHMLGMEDARCFHRKMNLCDPLEKLSAGPVHFAHSGWAFVDILPESHPSPDENFFLKYHHPYSFEADSWLSQGQPPQDTVCIMSAAYSSGWCEESFGIPLTAVEISCRARGDQNCTFIMAPPGQIQNYLDQEPLYQRVPLAPGSPLFFNRKVSEEKIKASLQEKELMLQEIHHRVKNNLQMIVSLMGLQLQYMQDEQAKAHMRYTQDRIAAIAMIHEMLYESSDFNQIPYASYAQRLLQYLLNTLQAPEQQIELQLDIQDVYLNLQTAIPIGLILNELMTNALKHGLSQQQSGSIRLELRQTADNQFQLQFQDNGCGLPAGFELQQARSLGLKLIDNLSQQLDGELNMVSQQGCLVQLSFRQQGVY